ncbi:MAG: LysR family transcriptional regulator [Shewanella sp.]|nr:LysR family transcriptional regulator [Shewanella sp.]MCF1432175.1 LysR family transcriptional regulator [Shewanella sp.]MCF1437364.1 LysR family transcriptional regulator [Shewanella sp.]MCF1457645.1 LysR family transcriptional regulator [Shewanella sp.]
MKLDNLARVDLNLLVILQVLLEEQSVTRAARRLHLTQSTLSKNLSRLRDMLGDPLFQRTARGLKPTAHALQIAQRLPGTLESLYELTQPPGFTPASSKRQFSFAMVESAYETLIPQFIGPLLKAAPNIRLNSYLWMENSMQDLVQGQLDFAIAGRDLHPQSGFSVEHLPEGIEHETLFTDNQVCLVRKGHEAIQAMTAGYWDLDYYLSQSHVQVRCEGSEWWALDYHLAKSNQGRHLSATVPDFYGAASICAHSDLVFTLPASFARHACKLYPLMQLPLPLEFIPLAYVLLWHSRNNSEPGHQWLKQTILTKVEQVISRDSSQ